MVTGDRSVPTARGSASVSPDPSAPLPQGEEKQALVRSMFDAIAPRYDLVNRVMTFGLDRRWRRRTVKLLGLERPSTIADLGCGTGDLARELGCSGHRAIGLDLSFGMLRCARAGGAPLVNADAARLPLRDGGLDGVVSGFAVRNFADLPAVVAELSRVIRPGGRLALLEVGRPRSRVLRFGHHLWFTYGVPRLGALLSDGDAYRYLPRSVAYLPEFPRFASMLVDAGFTDVRQVPLTGGVAQCVTATRSPVDLVP
jgi:demethylmenaquinone methyltransferase/2-methoxy-6-polyprenyl-1,4-benzoquinol methylase